MRQGSARKSGLGVDGASYKALFTSVMSPRLSSLVYSKASSGMSRGPGLRHSHLGRTSIADVQASIRGRHPTEPLATRTPSRPSPPPLAQPSPWSFRAAHTHTGSEVAGTLKSKMVRNALLLLALTGLQPSTHPGNARTAGAVVRIHSLMLSREARSGLTCGSPAYCTLGACPTDCVLFPTHGKSMQAV